MKKSNTKKVNYKKSLLLLLLLAVFLIMSTYAWFTSNKLVKVNALDISVNASEGFQISLDGVNWKSVIQAADITAPGLTTLYSAHKNHVPGSMVPYSTALATNSDGLMEMFLGSVDTDENGEYVLTAEKDVEAKDSTAGYIAFDLFFRTNNDLDLFLAGEASVKDNASVITRQGKGMENSARVAFVEEGNVPYATSPNPPAGAVQPLNGGGPVKVWEPNYEQHTEISKTEAFNMYGIATNSPLWANRLDYDGIKAEIPTANAVLVNKATAALNPTYFANVPATAVVTTASNNNTDTDLGIKLEAGVTKMRIYMWLEGQDYDCSDSASGSDVSFKLAFTAQRAQTP